MKFFDITAKTAFKSIPSGGYIAEEDPDETGKWTLWEVMNPRQTAKILGTFITAEEAIGSVPDQDENGYPRGKWCVNNVGELRKADVAQP